MQSSLRSVLVPFAAAAVLAAPAPAGAAIVSADFLESLDLPTCCSSGPRIEQALGRALGAGFELTAADLVANPSFWNNSFNVDLDGVTPELRLTPDGSNRYQTITVTVSNIVFSLAGEHIAGFSLISDSATTPEVGVVTDTTSFTNDSFSVTIDISPMDPSNAFDFVPSGVARFGINLAVDQAPEPASLLLLGLGLAGMGFARRRI